MYYFTILYILFIHFKNWYVLLKHLLCSLMKYSTDSLFLHYWKPNKIEKNLSNKLWCSLIIPSKILVYPVYLWCEQAFLIPSQRSERRAITMLIRRNVPWITCPRLIISLALELRSHNSLRYARCRPRWSAQANPATDWDHRRSNLQLFMIHDRASISIKTVDKVLRQTMTRFSSAICKAPVHHSGESLSLSRKLPPQEELVWSLAVPFRMPITRRNVFWNSRAKLRKKRNGALQRGDFPGSNVTQKRDQGAGAKARTPYAGLVICSRV